MFKRILGITVLAGMMVLPGAAFAAEQVTGASSKTASANTQDAKSETKADSASDEKSGHKPIGFYVSGQLGASIENLYNVRLKNPGQSSTYYVISGDYISMPSQTETVFSGGLSAGFDLGSRLFIPVRAELNYTARSDAKANTSNDWDAWTQIMGGSKTYFNGTASVKNTVFLQTLMANVWIDIPTGFNFHPYLGGGVGFAFIDHKASATFGDRDDAKFSRSGSGSGNNTNFAWNVGAGIAYDFTQNWTVDLGYRFVSAGDSKIPLNSDNGALLVNQAKVKVQSNDVMLGLRYTF